MIHAHSSPGLWHYSQRPWPAFRADTAYTANRSASAVLPVRDVEPVNGILPAGRFRLIPLSAGWVVAAGSDPSDDLLLLGSYTGATQGVQVLPHHTSAVVLTQAYTFTRDASVLLLAARFAAGQSLTVRGSGHYGASVRTWRWDGARLDVEDTDYGCWRRQAC
jgi:hypothetical protein